MNRSLLYGLGAGFLLLGQPAIAAEQPSPPAWVKTCNAMIKDKELMRTQMKTMQRDEMAKCHQMMRERRQQAAQQPIVHEHEHAQE